jgi:hypothetical protein
MLGFACRLCAPQETQGERQIYGDVTVFGELPVAIVFKRDWLAAWCGRGFQERTGTIPSKRSQTLQRPSHTDS